MNIYNHILQAKNDGNKLLAVLIDPDKFQLKNALHTIGKRDTYLEGIESVKSGEAKLSRFLSTLIQTHNILFKELGGFHKTCAGLLLTIASRHAAKSCFSSIYSVCVDASQQE